ncbi:thermonuclease family protein [Brevibacillus sp. H7]|uniref:thermonuclease family protein n=1 Tax=Brevibacillus sp. H7 TaxID=3349138 RepID=UPI0038255C04
MRRKSRKAIAFALITVILGAVATGAYANQAPAGQLQTNTASEKKKPKVETMEIINNAQDAVLFLGSKNDAVLTLTATAKDQEGSIIEPKKVLWKSDNKKVATVDKDGKVAAVGIGTTEITAKVENVSASIEVTVKDGTSLPSPFLTVEKQAVNESTQNDGSIADQQVVVLSNGTFAAGMTKADVLINNMPAGLDFELDSVESTKLTIRFTGNAMSHFDSNDVTNASVMIAREKVSEAAEDLTSPEFVINFEDPATISIPDAKQQVGQTVTIKGIVTADNAAIGNGKLSTFMQEGPAGINIFNGSTSGFPDLKEGDEVFVTGKITVYRGLTEIVPSAGGIEVASRGNTLPAAKEATIEQVNDGSIAEPLEGTLVKVTGYINHIPGTPAGGGYNLSLIDEHFKGTTLRVMQGSMDISQLETGKWYEVTAILGQFDNSYQLIPRKQEDVRLLQDQPSPPDSAGTYESVVSDVVDGDTLHLTEPILGSTTVRFVNIDTPETYHTVRTPEDQNQKDHGERAKQYMKSLLGTGDRVQVKVGEQAKDTYGRLLAQVIRQRDGLLTNLEMVQKGYASTYFIWPIDEDSYETYQLAVKEAEREGKGIWNPYDPLLEQPFAFRAREQGKGFTRPVGNYQTKEYVSPEDWLAVPVESRVYFNSDEEAANNGYKPMDSGKLADMLAVANAKKALQVPYDGTAATIELPAAGTDGTAIHWTVQDPAQADIIHVQTGVVDRSTLAADTYVLLLATIEKGSAVQEKGFPVLVKKESAEEPGNEITDLFFSEYLEGSSNNKALEIYNGTGHGIDLTGGKYAIALYSNGSATPGSVFNLSGTLADGAVYVIANPSANSAILGKAQATSTVTNFNGDDAIVLYKNFDTATHTGVVLGVIGVVGSDPGTAWGTIVKTVDQTLVRKGTVYAGNTNTGTFDPAVEWDSKGMDYFDSLGSHTVTR